jgi:ketosteroid isomerase-like protein
MSQENVDALRRAIEAATRQDIEALLEELDSEVEWVSAILVPMGGGARVARGHEGVGDMFRDFYDVFGEIEVEFSEFRDLGDRVLATGSIRIRGKESGAETETPWGYVADFKNGKATRIRTYTHLGEAFEAAGLRE